MTENINVYGWKGEDVIEIKEEESLVEGKRYDTVNVIEHRKNKETGDIYYNENRIPKENVLNLFEIIKYNCEPNLKYGYKYLVRKVIEFYELDDETGVPVDYLMEAFNGGRYRAKYYFPLLYYPLKVLEAKGLVDYLGRGGIIRKGGELLWKSKI